MRNIKVLAVILTGALAVSGCSLGVNNKELYALPDAPVSYEQRYEGDDTLITVGGRDYSLFGTVKDKFDPESIRECLGYVDGDENTRLYTLSDDPYDSYIMVRNVNGMMEQPLFYRATDTRCQDIYTPSYIMSGGYEEWESSGLHYEMSTSILNVTCNAGDVMHIYYDYKINGEDAGCGYTGYASHDEIETGDIFSVEINEWNLNGKAEDDEVFDISMTFSVETTDGQMHEVEGSFDGKLMLGATVNRLEITSEGDRYILVVE